MRILILGAYGQVGLELIRALSKKMPTSNIFCADIRDPPPENALIKNHIRLNAMDKEGLFKAIN